MEFKLHSVYKTTCKYIYIHIERERESNWTKKPKTKQKTNALFILETQNFKMSTWATSATVPE